MLAEERHNQILNLVNTRSSIRLNELCEELGISESTARRDLRELASKNLLIKVHGGAMSKNDSIFHIESNMEEKSEINVAEKDRIGRYAASLIEEGDCIFIDAGTTTGCMIDYLSVKNLLVVTNGMGHALRLAKRGYRVMVTGGEVKASTEALVGTECIQCLSKLNFTKSFIGANGVSLKRGITTPDAVEAATKELVIDRSKKSFVMADYAKFDKITTVEFAPLKRVVIITDHVENRKYLQSTQIVEVNNLD